MQPREYELIIIWNEDTIAHKGGIEALNKTPGDLKQ